MLRVVVTILLLVGWHSSLERIVYRISGTCCVLTQTISLLSMVFPCLQLWDMECPFTAKYM